LRGRLEIQAIAEHDEGQHITAVGVAPKTVKAAAFEIHCERFPALGLMEWTPTHRPTASRTAECAKLALVQSFRRWKQFTLEV
jgi:hypothetical protein